MMERNVFQLTKTSLAGGLHSYFCSLFILPNKELVEHFQDAPWSLEGGGLMCGRETGNADALLIGDQHTKLTIVLGTYKSFQLGTPSKFNKFFWVLLTWMLLTFVVLAVCVDVVNYIL